LRQRGYGVPKGLDDVPVSSGQASGFSNRCDGARDFNFPRKGAIENRYPLFRIMR
jgi:hypothetical protein